MLKKSNLTWLEDILKGKIKGENIKTAEENFESLIRKLKGIYK